MYAYIDIGMCVYIYIYICIYICKCTYLHMHMYIYIHVYIDKYHGKLDNSVTNQTSRPYKSLPRHVPKRPLSISLLCSA